MESGSNFPVSAQTTKDAEYVKLQSFSTNMRKQSLQQTKRRAQTACTEKHRKRPGMQKQRTKDYDYQEFESERNPS